MTDVRLAGVCGLDCRTCPHHGQFCRGCGHEQGKPFWTEGMPNGVCPLYDCCANGKRLEHCGLCGALPCEAFQKLRDPSLTEETFQKSLKTRLEALRRRKTEGTAHWLAEFRCTPPLKS